MRFRPHGLLERVARLILVRDYESVPRLVLQVCRVDPRCRGYGDAAAAAVALDAAVDKPPASGGSYGRPDLTVIHLALDAGPAWLAATCACSLARSGVEPLTAGLLASYAVIAEGRVVSEHGFILASSMIAAMLSTGYEPSHAPLLARRSSGLSAALFYLAHTARPRPSWAPRMGYAGLPDIHGDEAPQLLIEQSVDLSRVLEAAAETSILWRDFMEGLPRVLDLARLPPDAAIVEAVRVYSRDSGLARRRCGAFMPRRDPRDAWLSSLSGCSPGDAVDLGLLAALLSILEERYPARL